MLACPGLEEGIFFGGGGGVNIILYLKKIIDAKGKFKKENQV